MKNQLLTTPVVDAIIRIIFISIILVLCLVVMHPFVSIILWTVILGLAIYPLHKKLTKALGGKLKLASFIIVFIFMAVFIVPTLFLAGTLVDEVKLLKTGYDNGTLSLPQPDESVKEWPVIGKKLYDNWFDASAHIEEYVAKHEEQLVKYGSKFATGILSALSGIIQLLISFIIAGVLLGHGATGEGIRKFFRRISGERGDDVANLIIKTVGSVVKGILGESLVMALLNGTVFLLAGVPFAGLLTLLAFVFAVLQIPVLLISIPVVIYLFSVKSLTTAIIWTVGLLLVSLSDNFLTPLMLGKGAPVPTVVIFIGVIGGFFAFGFIGLFTGAILMSIGYSLFMSWFNSENESPMKDQSNT